VDGFEIAKDEALNVLDKLKTTGPMDRDALITVARTSLRTKVAQKLADHLTEAVVDAVLAIRQEDKPIDLHMVEIMTMLHKTEIDINLVRGIVLDYGARHPDMPKRMENCLILTCNVSMEYEKTEVNSGFFYKTAQEREAMVIAERQFIDERVRKVIAFKKQVCGEDGSKSFVIVNQKGIDPISLDMLAREGIFAVRRAKRRNMERVTLACGGIAMNSFDDLDEGCLGHAGLVYEHVLGETKYTFIEDVQNPRSVTLLIKGPNNFTIAQIKDALRDGLRAVHNAIRDGAVVPGAGAFELAAHRALTKHMATVKGRARLGVQAFADALLIIPKVLAQNAGFDPQDTIVTLQEEAQNTEDAVGLDINTGEACLPMDEGIVDNYCVKRQLLKSCTMIASSLLLVDEVMRAGLSSLKQ
jgi:T-complex protein 1 subunit zeta